MNIFNLKEKPEFIKEVATLEYKEWGNMDISCEQFKIKINNKIKKIKNYLDNSSYCKLILLDGSNLVGFISIFPYDGTERTDLTPWYATMYVKEKYRGKGYSKLLNCAIKDEAKRRGFKKIYLKTDLNNYYEKFGAVFMEYLKNGEKLYYIDLR